MQINDNPALLVIANAQFDLEKKLQNAQGLEPISRQILRIKNALESLGIFIQNPIGEPYNETRTDLEASIESKGTENLHVVSVIKPIIFQKTGETASIIQRGIVIVTEKRD